MKKSVPLSNAARGQKSQANSSSYSAKHKLKNTKQSGNLLNSLNSMSGK
jgi:hypothetical protein